MHATGNIDANATSTQTQQPIAPEEETSHEGFHIPDTVMGVAFIVVIAVGSVTIMRAGLRALRQIARFA